MAAKAVPLAAQIETFGGWPQQNPRVFLQNAEQQMVLSGIETAAARARFLQLCLEVDSPADMWFQTLNVVVQMDWDQLGPMFVRRWAQRAAPATTGMEKTEQLLNHRIKSEDVGKQVPFLGGTEYTHVVWAEEMIALAQELSLESWTEYLYQVINTLPNAIRDNIKGTTVNWTEFTDSVRAINTENLI